MVYTSLYPMRLIMNDEKETEVYDIEQDEEIDLEDVVKSFFPGL